MLVRLLVIGLLGGLCGLASGCGATVDPETGRVATNLVWFDQTGTAHCPHAECMPDPKLKPTEEETKESLVKPNSNVCEKGHKVAWTAADVPCWACDGGGKCRSCRGTGLVGGGKACAGCITVSDEGASPTGTGHCSTCDGKGAIRYGVTDETPN